MSTLLFSLLLGVAGVAAQDTPPAQINAALNALSDEVGQPVTLDDLARYTYEGRQFNTAALGCPQPGEIYAQGLTPGYQFTLSYDGQRYDYRVSEDESTVILCSVESLPQDGASDAPLRRTIDNPTVAVSPLVTEPGATVQAIVNGFPPNQVVLIGLGRPNSEYDVLRTTRTNNQGVVTPQVTIPTGFSPVDDAVIVIETQDNSVRVVSMPIRIMSDDPTTAPSGNPVVTLDSREPAPGSDVTLTASGFPPNTDLIIGVRPQFSNDYIYSLRETANAEGSLTTQLAVPEDVQVNRPYVVLVEVARDRNYEALSPAFVPTGTTPPPPPEGAEFTRADIYLIAPGDGGQNGIPIACDDSAVPVQVSFAPTVAPLTAALEQLLAINSRTYGESGLYNALYQSALRLESINIEEGRATIALSGSLSVGGVCDSPRVDAQIRNTALQFSTVDAVDILVNGQPLSEVLSANQ